MKVCSIPNCERKVAHRGMCRSHWKKDIDENRKGTRSRFAENEAEIVDKIVFISLYNSRGEVKAKAIIDLDDYERVREYTWSLKSCKGELKYAINTKAGRLHHFIMKSKNQLDHINSNGLDNRKENLRPATQHQNCRNMLKPSHNSSGAKGVSWNKQHGKYESYITINNIKKSLGFYPDLIEAAIIYNEAAIEYFKEFAKINNIENLKLLNQTKGG